MPTPFTRAIAAEYRKRQQSYWVARFRDRDDVYEWECDWSLLNQRGLMELRLHCPDGTIAVLGNDTGIEGRAFQLKTAYQMADGQRGTTAHLIGIVLNENGDCKCHAWSYEVMIRCLAGHETTMLPRASGPIHCPQLVENEETRALKPCNRRAMIVQAQRHIGPYVDNVDAMQSLGGARLAFGNVGVR